MRKIALILATLFVLNLCVTAVAWQKGAASKKAESSDYYHKWLEEDVLYIISDEEKAVFQKLSTGEERDQFIEQFWQRRNPDPPHIWRPSPRACSLPRSRAPRSPISSACMATITGARIPRISRINKARF